MATFTINCPGKVTWQMTNDSDRRVGKAEFRIPPAACIAGKVEPLEALPSAWMMNRWIFALLCVSYPLSLFETLPEVRRRALITFTHALASRALLNSSVGNGQTLRRSRWRG